MRDAKQKHLLIAAVIATVFLLVYPCKVLLADYYFARARNILTKQAVGNPDTAEISETTLPAYREAIESLRKSTGLVPSRPIYWKSLFDIYLRLAKWASVMEITKGALPPDAFSKEEAFKKAEESMRIAIALDPLNPDYRLAFARFWGAADGSREKAVRELHLAVEAAPMNAPLRYELALRYLLLGDKDNALEHARVLARIDESYRLYNDPAGPSAAPRRDSWYVSHLAGSYLAKSMEISWRASGKKINQVRSIVPDNPDAQQALLLFLESKGIE